MFGGEKGEVRSCIFARVDGKKVNRCLTSLDTVSNHDVGQLGIGIVMFGS